MIGLQRSERAITKNKRLGWFDAHEARPAREILLARVDLILEMHKQPLAKLKENDINA